MSTADPFTITGGDPSAALFGLCRWTSSTGRCLGTLLPIVVLGAALLVLAVYHFLVTPQRSALAATVPPQRSPLLPEKLRVLNNEELAVVLGGVNEVPLKNFLPRVGLDELVEPSATLGIANVKDLLKANRLALRDMGIGPKEARVFARALERRIRVRERMQDLFTADAAGAGAKPSVTKIMRQRAIRFRAAPEDGLDAADDDFD